MAGKKRSNGEGTVPILRADGRWMQQYVGADGKRRTVYGKTATEVVRKLREALNLRDRGVDVPAGALTVGRFLDEWLAERKGLLEESTWVWYERIVRVHLRPGLGSVKLRELGPRHVSKLYLELVASGLSPVTVHGIHRVLHKVLKDAMRRELVYRNVSELVDKPAMERYEASTVSGDELGRLLAALASDCYGREYLLALNCGLRLGELVALQWSDVDLEAGRLQVRRARKRGVNGWYTGVPKSKRSKRIIALTATAVEALRRQRVVQMERRLAAGARWQDLDLVFSGEDGSYLSHWQLERHWPVLLRRADLPHMRPHDLRHSFSTLLRQHGVTLETVSQLLGHADPALTARIYSHVSMQMQESAAEVLERVMAAARSDVAEAQ
jgi:integrase